MTARSGAVAEPCACVSVWDSSDGLHTAVRQRSAGLHGRHAHPNQAQGKKLVSTCSPLRVAEQKGFQRMREIARELICGFLQKQLQHCGMSPFLGVSEELESSSFAK